jgi:hypothetical protein
MEEETKVIPKYAQEFDSFMASYKNDDSTTGEKVGHMVAIMSQYFTEYNLRYAEAKIKANKVAASYEQSSDESTGKPLSSAKAKVLSEASPEYAQELRTKVDVENIEQDINALKSLQKGILFEYNSVQ